MWCSDAAATTLGPARGVREYCARWAEMRVRTVGLCACAVSGAAACACGVRTWEYYTGGQHTRWTKAKQRWLCGPAACASAESYRGCSPPLYPYNYSRMMQQVGGLTAMVSVQGWVQEAQAFGMPSVDGQINLKKGKNGHAVAIWWIVFGTLHGCHAGACFL